MRNEPSGLPAGGIAKLLDVPHNTMSSHLSILSRTGLISGMRDGRSIVYRVDLAMVRGFFVYLLKDCCDGRPELCQPLLNDLTPCCQPTGAACA
jgi:DNA-binding transcriptional ArsR family regulator